MISEHSVNIIRPLVPWMDEGVCDVSIHNEIARIEFEKLDCLTSFLLDQTQINSISCKAFSSWKLDLESYLPTKIISTFYKSNNDEWPINFQKSGNLILLDILDTNTLAHWIKINKAVRYLYIPISLNPEYGAKRSGHACSLIIDNGLNEIYFFDPNGKTSYFGFTHSSCPIDILLENYFKDLETDYSLGYSYINNTTTKFYQLNRDFSFSLIANPGNCMILSILFPHFLSLTQVDIYSGIAQLGELNDSELITLINGYSVGICRLCLS